MRLKGASCSLTNSETSESESAASSSSNNASSPSRRQHRLELVTIGKQKTVILADSNQNSHCCIVEEELQNNTAATASSAIAKRNAFKANRANAVTIVDVHAHHLPLLQEICDNDNDDDDPYLINDLNSFMDRHPLKVTNFSKSTNPPAQLTHC